MLFKKATLLSQIAFQVNKGSPLWDTAVKGQFSQLVKTALRRLKLGMSDSDSIPYFPDGFDPLVELTNPLFAITSPSRNWAVSAPSFIFPHARTFQIVITCIDCYTDTLSLRVEETTISQGSSFSFAFRNENRWQLLSGSTFQAITSDNSLFGGLGYIIKPFPIYDPAKPDFTVEFTWSASQIDTTLFRIYLTPNVGFLHRTWQINASFRLTPNSGGAQTNVSLIGTFSPQDGYLTFQIPPAYQNNLSGIQIISGAYFNEQNDINLVFRWNDFPIS
jgi:hypothetical protein